MAKKRLVEYEGRKVSLSQLAELTKINREILYLRYRRGDRGSNLVRPVSTENKKGSIMAKRLDVHEVWGRYMVLQRAESVYRRKTENIERCKRWVIIHELL